MHNYITQSILKSTARTILKIKLKLAHHDQFIKEIHIIEKTINFEVQIQFFKIIIKG